MKKITEYFKIHLNKKTDRELITWLLKDRDIFESPAFAARRAIYICMEKLKRRRTERQVTHGEKRKKEGEKNETM